MNQSLCFVKVTYQSFLAKGLKNQYIGMNIKQKVKEKITANEYRYFLEYSFVRVRRLFVLVYLNRNNDVKRYKVRVIIYQKILSKIITSSIMEKPSMTNPLTLI